MVALQIPITYELGGQTLTVTTPDTVLQSAPAGYAVHVWLSNDEENAKVYNRLLSMCVDGIMAAKPRLLEKTLRAGNVVRPDGRGTDPCSVRATKATLKKGSVAVVLWCGEGSSRRRTQGTVRVRAGGKLLGHETFSLAEGDRRRRRDRAAVEGRKDAAKGHKVRARAGRRDHSRSPRQARRDAGPVAPLRDGAPQLSGRSCILMSRQAELVPFRGREPGDPQRLGMTAGANRRRMAM